MLNLALPIVIMYSGCSQTHSIGLYGHKTRMKINMSGNIIFLCLAGILFNDVYAASKFAVEGFCESLAIQALRFNLK